jgi:hypothetical protein
LLSFDGVNVNRKRRGNTYVKGVMENKYHFRKVNTMALGRWKDLLDIVADLDNFDSGLSSLVPFRILLCEVQKFNYTVVGAGVIFSYRLRRICKEFQ